MRRAAGPDAARVAQLWRDLHAHHAALDPAFELRPGAEQELSALMARQLADPDCAVFVAGAAAQPAAFCVVRLERAPRALREIARAEITELAVAPALRRQGIGRALAEAAREWAASCGAARLEVRVAVRNREGQAFWRALGYDGFVDVLARRL